MQNTKSYILLFSGMLAFALSLVACQPTAQIEITPALIPITLTVDTQGHISFVAQKAISYPTFLGTFSASIGFDAAQHFNVKNTLTVRLDGIDYVYDLHGQDFALTFAKGYYEDIGFRKEGTNLFLELRRANTTAAPTQPVAPQLVQPVSCDATPHVALPQGNHFFTGAIHVAELWRANGQTPWGNKLVRAIVYGDINISASGGSVWTYPAGRDTRVQIDVSNNLAATIITEAQMREAGLIK